MNDLLAKLQCATGPSRFLDEAIARGCGWVTEDKSSEWMDEHLPRYSLSIDAALLLVPDGLNYVLRSLQGHAEARVGGWKDGYQIKDGHHAFPAIALCIAALRARLVTTGKSDAT